MRFTYTPGEVTRSRDRVIHLVMLRHEARRRKEFKRADELRQEIASLVSYFKDTKTGYEWETSSTKANKKIKLDIKSFVSAIFHRQGYKKDIYIIFNRISIDKFRIRLFKNGIPNTGGARLVFEWDRRHYLFPSKVLLHPWYSRWRIMR